jgi:purine-nucleoside phosphorylase
MGNMYQKITEAAEFLKKSISESPLTGIILGTGLGKLVNQMSIEVEIPYSAIPHFVVSTVETHTGRLVFGRLNGRPVVVMNGRFHFYEGYDMQQITFPVRVMKQLGISELLISNACGAINPAFESASLMLIDDHINFLPMNPLVGANISELGSRFPDMSAPYSPEINQKLRRLASDLQIGLHEGVYAAWIGPSLETRAEYRFLRMAGADVVGMSTVPEVIVANHMGLPVSAISVITDLCDPDNLKPLRLEDVLKNAARAEKKLSLLFSELMKEL